VDFLVGEVDEMKDNKWHKGPPPSVGWWPASFSKNDANIRWWNGENWSFAASVAFDRGEVNKIANQISKIKNIYWKHRPDSWPERSKT
jgi:hypothetical protein